MNSQKNDSALRNLSALVDFSNTVNSSLKLDFILNNLLLTVFAKLQTTKGIVALTDDNKNLKITYFKGISSDVPQNFPVVNINDFDKNKEFIEFLKKYGFVLYEKISTSSEKLGVVILGQKITKQEYSEDDRQFLKTLVNISSTAIENTLTLEKLKKVNLNLDAKINQLSSLFDLSKEFSGILEEERVSKLLVFSVIAQMLVSQFAVLVKDKETPKILESNIKKDKLLNIINSNNIFESNEILYGNELKEKLPELYNAGFVLSVPMVIKNVVRGVILLGKRLTGKPFSQSDLEYISSVASLAVISIENSRLFKEALEKQKLEKDLELARTIQKNLLPKKIPVFDNVEIAAYNKTAKQVGGDYYDVIQIDHNNVLIAIADVSGKGVQAALLMANLQAFLKAIIKQNIPLVEASNLINDLVSENTTMGSFITFFWGILNTGEKTFTYVNAGHNPPILVRNGNIIKLKIGGMILGVMTTVIDYQFETVQLEKGDVIVMFTDGITEAMDTEKNEYSDERLEKLILDNADGSAKEILNKIIDDVNEHTWGAEQSDDITCCVIKVKE